MNGLVPPLPLALLPTPLEDGGSLPSGRRLWIKRDDLTGLGMGGNKARKLATSAPTPSARAATCWSRSAQASRTTPA